MKLCSFHNLSRLRFILKILIKFRKFQPRYSYKISSYMGFHFSRMYDDTQQTKRSYHKLCHRSSANGEWRSSLKPLTINWDSSQRRNVWCPLSSRQPSLAFEDFCDSSSVQRLPVVQESSIIMRSKTTLRVNALTLERRKLKEMEQTLKWRFYT